MNVSVSYDIKSEFLKEEILSALNDVRRPVEIAVWGCCNAFNFGASIRTAHNFLARKIYGIDIDWFYKKAAMTALQHEKQNLFIVSTDQFLEQTQNRNIVAFEKRENIKSRDLRTFQFPENPILLFGSEKFGIPDSLLARANHVVTIPCDGLVLDHNISVAIGIALYDWYNKFSRRQNAI